MWLDHVHDLVVCAGIPVKVTNVDDKTVKDKPLDLYTYLNKVG